MHTHATNPKIRVKVKGSETLLCIVHIEVRKHLAK